MNNLKHFYEQAEVNPIEALTDDLKHSINDGNKPEAKKIITKLKLFLNEDEELNFLNASKWIEQETEEPNPIIESLFETGDKLAIIGTSKARKSFLTLQLCICVAVGKPFMGLQVSQKRKVIYIQFEIKDKHCHRRLKNMCLAMEIDTHDLEDRLLILNGRGLGITGTAGIERIQAAVKDLHPDFIVFDPLYKLSEGVENAAEDMKKTMAGFDALIEATGAAIGYVHHDAKGSPGDRNIQDRGAGSNVLARDYDACLALSEHASSPGAVVIEALLRNYPPMENFSIQWTNDGEGYCFRRADDIIPEKKTSRTKPAPPPLSSYYPAAREILGKEEINVTTFKDAFKNKTGLSDKRIREFMAWAQDINEPRILSKEAYGRALHTKHIRLAEYEEV